MSEVKCCVMQLHRPVRPMQYCPQLAIDVCSDCIVLPVCVAQNTITIDSFESQ